MRVFFMLFYFPLRIRYAILDKTGKECKMETIVRELKTVKLRNLVMLTLAGMVNAFGVTVFLAPVNLYDSGISGTSMLLARLTPEEWSLSVFLLLLNVPLFLFGYKKQGPFFAFF